MLVLDVSKIKVQAAKMQQQLLSTKRAPKLVVFVGVASLMLILLLCSSHLQRQSQDCFCPDLENPEQSAAAAVSASSLSRDLPSARRDLESRGVSATSAAVPVAGDSQPSPAAATIGSVAAFSGGNDGGSGASRDAARDDSNQQFIYVYDTQWAWTDKIKGRAKEWYSDQYDVESVVTELLMRSNAIRTTDPEKATLFYVPYYSSNHISHVNKLMKNMMHKSVGEVSKAWHDILTMIRRDYPYFNRTNGRDHFGTSTFDHGRCLALPWVNPDLYGEMFFIVLNGDRLARTIHSSKKRNMQIIGYNYNMTLQPQYPDIPCYMPDRDIVVPAFVGGQLPMVSPFTGDRPMRAIFRFSTQPSHRAPLKHHGHSLRPELLKMYGRQRIKGWSFAARGERQTNKEWQMAVFCICPPGHSQWTSRPFKALISGCIPVTFFRDHDNPWDDELDYSSFSINIDPDDIASLRSRLETAPVEQLQRGVETVQRMFKWSGNHTQGAKYELMKRLRQRGKQLSSTSLFV
ncbi:unnamed protein product [Closterium sp. NIES-65]|nr:unnamed protein product [Closterium sp. NIES-65]